MTEVRFDFTGRVVLVTGAARGIGSEIARLFCESGARVHVVDMDQEALDALEWDAVGRHLVDVAHAESVDRLVQEIVDHDGRLDVVVNNAGILRDAMLWKMSDADWDTVLNVHAGGTFRITRAAVPHFRNQGYGRVVNVTSYTGLHGNIGQANYATAKAGVIGLTKTAAKELAAFGVTVNAVSPNAATRMIDSIPDDTRAAIESQIPLGRFADPHEIAAAVAFLASEQAGYITGVVLPVDGGLAM